MGDCLDGWCGIDFLYSSWTQAGGMMSTKKAYPKMLFMIIFVMLLFGIMATLVINQANKSRSKLPIWNTLTDFQFTAAHNGQPFGLEQMKGKLSVVDFVFTRCKSVCPITMVNMSELYELYQGSDKVQFVSISVDPEYDSLAILKAFGEKYGVNDNHWIFLRAPVEDVARVCESDFMLPAENLPGGHTSKFILVDTEGNIRSYHEGLNSDAMTSLKNNIRQLARGMP
jgi:protein SCO1